VEELFQYVCRELESREIAYMVSGSVAMGAYTVARYTRDIDLVIELTESQLDSFGAVFADPTKFYFRRPSAEEEVRRRGIFNVISQTSGFKIDFIVKKETPFPQSEFSRKRPGQIWNIDCWIISVEDLILAKLIWIQDLYSENQSNDIRNLLMDNPDLDRVYLNKWITELRLNTLGLY